MRSTFRIAILATFFLAMGCSRYDRELMGEPEPAPPAKTAYVEEAAAQTSEAEDTLGVGMFNELRYYGQWYWVDPYGWVWRPTVVSEWHPFTNGHWIWSQYGWMWVDYDQWGWATSHYGYWTTDFTMGWIWVPDYQWSPCQCDWLVYDDYISWSPVPPPGVKYKDPWDAGDAWVTVPVRKFKEQDVGFYRAIPKVKSDVADNISHAPPDIREVERHGGKFPLVEVQLDRRVVGEREFAKVRFPAGEEQIIQGRRSGGGIHSTPLQSTPPQPATSASPGGGSNNPTVSPVKVQPEKAKSKDSTPKNDGNNGSGKTTKYKEKKSDEKKDDGKSKDESKTEKKGKG